MLGIVKHRHICNVLLGGNRNIMMASSVLSKTSIELDDFVVSVVPSRQELVDDELNSGKSGSYIADDDFQFAKDLFMVFYI